MKKIIVTAIASFGIASLLFLSIVASGTATNISLPPGNSTTIKLCSTSLSLSASKSPSILSCKATTSTTTTTVPPTTTTTTTGSGGGGGNCTNPVTTLTASNDTYTIPTNGPEYWWVNQDEWNGNHGTQSMTVCSQSSWTATDNQPNIGGQVETYPDSEYDIGGRSTSGPGVNSTTPISGFSSITSTFAETFPSAGGWDAGYDLWTNDFTNETMVWNQWAGSQAFWPACANGASGCPSGGNPQALTLGGVPYHFFNNGGELMFFRDTQVSSGSANLLAAFQWEVAHGYASSSDVPTQLEYGVEVCYTSGNENFPLTGLTMSVSP